MKKAKKNYSVLDLAEALGQPRQTVSYGCKHGLIPGAEQVGRNWIIPRYAYEKVVKRGYVNKHSPKKPRDGEGAALTD